jgi:hypothetical protein
MNIFEILKGVWEKYKKKASYWHLSEYPRLTKGIRL